MTGEIEGGLDEIWDDGHMSGEPDYPETVLDNADLITAGIEITIKLLRGRRRPLQGALALTKVHVY